MTKNLEERVEKLRLEFENCPITDLERFIRLDQQVSQYLSHGPLSPEMREKLLATFKKQDAALLKEMENRRFLPKPE